MSPECCHQTRRNFFINHCYVKKGTRFERVVKNAKDFGTGKPEETYLIKGIARENRSMIIEAIERAD